MKKTHLLLPLISGVMIGYSSGGVLIARMPSVVEVAIGALLPGYDPINIL